MTIFADEIKGLFKNEGFKYWCMWDGMRIYYKKSNKFGCFGFIDNEIKYIFISSTEKQKHFPWLRFEMYTLLDLLPFLFYYPTKKQIVLYDFVNKTEKTFDSSPLIYHARKKWKEKIDQRYANKEQTVV